MLPLLALVVIIFSFGPHIKEALTTDPKTSSSIMGAQQKQSEIENYGLDVLQRWELPERLLEISGVSWLDKDRFACVQDEMGIVFIYNTATSKIEKEISFAGTGDYEGIAIVDDASWVVRSDGYLYEITSITAGKPTINEYDTPLTPKHDTEGLCYDQKNHRLLLAIKEIDPGNTDYKGIYGFDLRTKKMGEVPIIKIDLQHEIFTGISSGKKKSKPGDAIMPSDISVHPSTGDIYIIEGRKPKLMVINSTNDVKTFMELDKNDFLQPEGITFSPTGEMFISNEGVKDPGNILKVKLVKR